jgi:two-component system alkaline phosphatase synthesis response regulator PhoP
VIRHDVFEIDTVKYEFRLRGEKIPLTQLEFDVLALLMKHPGEVLTRDEILDQVWGKEVFVTPRTVDAHISKMRQKFSQPEDQDRIVPFRGVGYKFLAFNKT